MGGSLGRNLGGAQGGVPQKIFFFAKYSQTPIYGISVEKKVTPRVVFLKGPPLGPPLEFFSVSGWVGAPPWVSLMWGPLEGPPLGPPLEIFSVSGVGRGPPSAPPQIYYGHSRQFFGKN